MSFIRSASDYEGPPLERSQLRPGPTAPNVRGNSESAQALAQMEEIGRRMQDFGWRLQQSAYQLKQIGAEWRQAGPRTRQQLDQLQQALSVLETQLLPQSGQQGSMLKAQKQYQNLPSPPESTPQNKHVSQLQRLSQSQSLSQLQKPLSVLQPGVPQYKEELSQITTKSGKVKKRVKIANLQSKIVLTRRSSMCQFEQPKPVVDPMFSPARNNSMRQFEQPKPAVDPNALKILPMTLEQQAQLLGEHLKNLAPDVGEELRNSIMSLSKRHKP